MLVEDASSLDRLDGEIRGSSKVAVINDTVDANKRMVVGDHPKLNRGDEQGADKGPGISLPGSAFAMEYVAEVSSDFEAALYVGVEVKPEIGHFSGNADLDH